MQRVWPGVVLRVSMVIRYGEFTCAVKFLQPVFRRAILRGVGGVGPLPLRVLTVLPDLRQLGRDAAAPGRVKSPEVTHDHLQRPGIRYRVMHREEQDAVPVIELIQQRPQHRHFPCRHRARLDLDNQFLDDHVSGLAGHRRRIPDLQRHRTRRPHHLVGRIGVPDHQGAKQLVALHDVVEGALQQGEIHVTGDADRADQDKPTAERSTVIALVQRDKPFLRKRKRVSLRFLVQSARGFRNTAIPLPDYFRASAMRSSWGSMSPTVGALNRSAIDTRIPRELLMRPASIIASIERPPRSKKSLSTPHLATPSTWANSSHRSSCRGVLGAWYGSRPFSSGTGSAATLTAPAAVAGISSTTTIAAGMLSLLSVFLA